MSNNILRARLINIHDVEYNWNRATTFIPRAGEVVVYDVDENHSYPRFKIGDGRRSVVELPFALEDTIRDFFGEDSGVVYLDGGRIGDYN